MEFWFSEFHTPDVKHSIRVNKQLYSKQSDYQRIDIFETPEFGRVLTLDGNVMLTERDEFIYDEMIVHVPMAVHKEARDILVIGAGDGGVVRELTRYDRVERIDLVEMDPQVVEACRAYLPGNACRLDDARVKIYFENGEYYQGSFCDDMMYGKGVCFYSNGLPKYVGEMRNNQRNGEGIEYDTNGEILEQGFYVNGECIIPVE